MISLSVVCLSHIHSIIIMMGGSSLDWQAIRALQMLPHELKICPIRKNDDETVKSHGRIACTHMAGSSCSEINVM